MGNSNGESKQTKHELDVLISEMNAQALADNLAELRLHYDGRLTALENEVMSLNALVTSQSKVLGETLARLMGHGSTETPQ